MIRFNLPVVAVCLLGSLLVTPMERAFGKIVLVGDAYVDDEAHTWVIYYKNIPGVANPGQRKHVCGSFDELKDELRRAKNNEWEIDFDRSYQSYVILAGINDNDPPRRSLAPGPPSVAGTVWKGVKGDPWPRNGGPGGRYWPAIDDFRVYFKRNGTYEIQWSDGRVAGNGAELKWEQNGDQLLLDADSSIITSFGSSIFLYKVNRKNMLLVAAGRSRASLNYEMFKRRHFTLSRSN
jgi:hypothetical protein